MKNAFHFGILLIGIAILTQVPAAAQYCGMITLSETYLDDSGIAIAVNYTDADSLLCGDYLAYADVTLSMPSGFSQFASVSAGSFAEAIVVGDAVDVDGAGFASGSNELTFACTGFFLTSIFGFDIRWAHTLVKLKLPRVETNCETTLFNTFCDYDGIYWCTPETSPPLYKATGVRRVLKILPDATAWYWKTTALCERPSGTTIPWACIAGALDSPPMTPNRPPEACTKDPT